MSQEEDLTELAAPAPVQNVEEDTRYRREENLEEAESEAAEPPTLGRTEPYKQVKQKPSELATLIYTVSYLIFFSLFGTLARLGVQWLTFYPGAPVVTPVLWANFSGSLVMGFLSEDLRLFREEWGDSEQSSSEKDQSAFKKAHGKVKKSIPLYIGLATGFCGSFTSFSSFVRDVFLALSNSLPTPVDHPYGASTALSFSSTVHRNGGYSFMALVAVIILTISLSLSALQIGAHVALALDRWTPTLPFRFTRRILDPVIAFLAIGCWLGAIFLSIFPPDRPGGPASRGAWSNEVWRGEVLFALVFAPLGCLLRWYASLKLNALLPSFPLGTFVVNVFGTAVLGACYDLQHVPLLPAAGLVGGGRVGCQVLQGVEDGFCGCLTTVSTWVTELQGLRRRHAWVYGAASVVTSLALLVVIMGSVRWTTGWDASVCVTMRTSM
ncbi:hypothetical protein H2203_003071 [Taxawa tesnikishii (nom. ined.)]|nr:hypothetical protein H2203_003071 [Dothideales sp. JES 119]